MRNINDLQISFFSRIINKKPEIKNLDFLFSKLKDNNSKFHVEKARQLYNSSKEEYRNFRLNNLPAVDVRCVYSNGKADNNGERIYNGLVFLDFDKVENCTLLKLKLIELPYIIACWTSTSGKGVHAIAYTENYIKDDTTYYNSFSQISLSCLSELGIIPDERAANSTQQTFISFDRNFHLKTNFEPFPIDINFKKEPNKNRLNNLESKQYTILDLDFYIKKFENFYEKIYITTKNTNLPVLFQEQLKYNSEIHTIQNKYLYENQLDKADKLNSTHTMGYFPGGIASISINLNKNYFIRNGSRKKTLTALILNYLWMHKHLFKNNNITEDEIYTILNALNLKCMDENGNKPCPVEDRELTRLTAKAYDMFLNNEIEPNIRPAKIAISHDFFRINIRDFKLSGNIKEKNQFMFKSEMMKLISGNRNKKQVVIDWLNENEDEMKSLNFKSKNQLACYISNQTGLSQRTINGHLSLLIKEGGTPFANPTTILIKDSNSLANTLPPHLLLCINEMKNQNLNISKKGLSKFSGISLKTVKKYWDKIQKEITK